MSQKVNCFSYKNKNIEFILNYDEISDLTNKDFLHFDISLFTEDILTNCHVRQCFQEYIQINPKKIEKRVSNYLDKNYKKTNNHDVCVEMLSNQLIDFCKKQELFSDILLSSSKDIVYRFLSILFISNNDIFKIIDEVFKNLESEIDYLNDEEFLIIFKEETYDALESLKI